MRYYVTSDTHGFYTALETALKTAGFFEDTQPHNYYETRNYVFTHGWLPCYPTRSGSYARIEDWRHALKDSWKRSRWYNGMDAFRTAYDEKTVVCGHWHASYGHSRYEHKGSEFGEDADFTPFMASGIIALDACTAHTGFVNCMIIEDEELPQPETAHAQGET